MEDFESKRPNLKSKDVRAKCGDNIYKPLIYNPLRNEDFEQLPSMHGPQDMDRDLSGKKVLISRNFHYFGLEAPELPEGLEELREVCAPEDEEAFLDRQMKKAEDIVLSNWDSIEAPALEPYRHKAITGKEVYWIINSDAGAEARTEWLRIIVKTKGDWSRFNLKSNVLTQ